jgi:hypothetical protein
MRSAAMDGALAALGGNRRGVDGNRQNPWRRAAASGLVRPFAEEIQRKGQRRATLQPELG